MLATGRGVRSAVALLGLTLAAGCGGSGGSHGSGASHPPAKASASSSAAAGSSAQDNGSVTITIDATGFGAPQTVNPGEPIKLINKGSAVCRVKYGATLNIPIPAGQMASITAPTVPGTYPLSCGLTPDVHGTLTVRGV